MSLKIKLLATVLVVSAPVMASAEIFNLNNYYVSGAGAWNILENEQVRNTSNMEADFKNGWGGLGAAGITINDNYRSELEIGYRDNKVKSIHGAPVAASGHNRTWTFMANGLYDFKNSSLFTPYLGVGVGVADIKYSNVALSSTTTIDDSSVRPAAQGIVGVNYKITDNFSLFTNYQYLMTSRFKVTSAAGSGVATDQYKANTFLAGLTYKFGTSEPAPVYKISPMASNLEASRSTYMLFFEWDKADLTPEGRDIVNAATEKALSMHDVTINITGHADRSGTEEHNMKLSKKRAITVQKAMIKQGILAKDIIIHAKGETEPLVPTADGVREPKNRRVVIVYSDM